MMLESVRKRKKVLRKVEVVSREHYEGLDLDTKVELVRSLVPLGLMYIEEMLDAEVRAQDLLLVSCQIGNPVTDHSGKASLQHPLAFPPFHNRYCRTSAKMGHIQGLNYRRG